MLRETAIALAASLALGGYAYAGAGEPTKSPSGQSEYAPGQKAKEPNAGEAKDYAPGQQMKKEDNTSSPGASEYAPGQQGTTKSKK